MRKPRYLRMMDAGPAWQTLRAHLQLPEPLPAETIPVEQAAGRVAAQPVWAKSSSPSYMAAAMDGFAVRAAETRAATEANPVALHDAQPIDTGDPVPAGFDAVVKIEDVHAASGAIEITAALVPWHNVRLVGEDIVQGEMILASGRRITPFDVGALLAAGLVTVSVRKRPRVAIIPTGDEIVEPGCASKPGDIIEFNGRMLAALVSEWGGEAKRFAPVRDKRDAIEKAVRDALAMAEVVVLLAGSSAGADDYTPDVVSTVGELLVHGVNVMPGKPTVLGVSKDGRALLGLPGYPVSCVVAAERFLAPAIAAWLGTPQQKRERVQARLARKTASKVGHEEVVRVQLARVEASEGWGPDELRSAGRGAPAPRSIEYVAHPLGRGAGVITSLSRAAGLFFIEALSEGVDAGATIDVELLRPRAEVDRTLLHVGSHDLALDVLADLFAARTGRALPSVHVGSIGGLIALGRGHSHLAGTHLIDPQTGEYNLSYVRKYAGDRSITLIELCKREQGWIVAPGNPLGIRGLADLPRARFVNRQRGAGTRVLLDLRLEQAGIDARTINGYEREEPTHMAVAVAVQSGSADVGLGVRAAASALGLDFVPLEWERYDLAIPSASVDAELLELIRTDAFRRAAEALSGYDASQSGRVVIET